MAQLRRRPGHPLAVAATGLQADRLAGPSRAAGPATAWARSTTGPDPGLTAAIVHPGGPASLVAHLRVRLWRRWLGLGHDADAQLRDLDTALELFKTRVYGRGAPGSIAAGV